MAEGCGEACGFGCGDAEQAHEGFGKLVYRGVLDVARVALVQPQQPKQPPGDGGQGDFRVGEGEAARGLAGLDITQGAWRQPEGCVQ